jgi:hypothetical protein
LRPDIWRLGVLLIFGEQGQVELSAFYLTWAAISSNKYVIYWLLAVTLSCIQPVRQIWKDFRVVPTKNRLDIRDVQPRSRSGPGPVQSVQERERWTDQTGPIRQMYWTETDRS